VADSNSGVQEARIAAVLVDFNIFIWEQDDSTAFVDLGKRLGPDIGKLIPSIYQYV